MATLITYPIGLFNAFSAPCAAQLSTSPLAPLLSCQPSFLALLLASPTGPDFFESHGCFRDTFLLSRFLFDPPEAFGRKLARFLPDAIQRSRRTRTVRDAEGTAERREP